MKTARSALILAVAAFAAGSLTADSARAQTKSTVRGELGQIPVYNIQVLYVSPRQSGYGGGYGHHGSSGGGYGGGYGHQSYTYTWVTIARTESLSEADTILELYELALDLGVLNEVAPPRANSHPIDVQMITTYRPITTGGTLTTNVGGTGGTILNTRR